MVVGYDWEFFSWAWFDPRYVHSGVTGCYAIVGSDAMQATKIDVLSQNLAQWLDFVNGSHVNRSAHFSVCVADTSSN